MLLIQDYDAKESHWMKYDNHGYDAQGFDAYGFDRQGLNIHGFDQQGVQVRPLITGDYSLNDDQA